MAATKKVDINTAKLEDFESLIGVGHAKAESIIEHRKVNGPYSSVADLKQILGIGPSILEQNKDLLTCSTPPSTSGKSSAQKGHGASERETRRSARTEGLTPASQSAASSSYGSSLSYSSSNGHSSSSGGSSGGSSPPTDDASTLSAARVRAASLRHRTSASASSTATASSSAPRTRGAERRMLRGQVAVVVGDEDDHDADGEEEVAETETHSPKGGGDRGERTRNTSNSSGETERGGANKDANSSKIRNDEELGKSDNNDNTAVNDAGADSMECSYGDTPGNVSEGVLASLRSRTSSAAATAAAAASEKALMKRKCEGGGANKDMSPGKKPCRLSTEDAASVASPIPSECSNSSGGPCSHDPCQHCLHCSQCGQSTTPPPPSHPSMAQMRKRIPSKTNPHPDLANWLKTYQEWSHAERLLALNELIELCEVTEVRHMMAVIEPQFQRDFISLLPKELALKVLTYLEPRDLCRAAQTCRYWRILASDNLLWREKCKEEAISEATVYENSVRKRNPCSKNPWKGLYLRQKDIEHRWRGAPIRDPKVLKGHDDHVITCLEFCGSRIVSGSDDNTLKVWSAVTGKCLRTLVGHTGGVWSSQMAGHVVISGSTDRTLRVWHADTGQCMHTLYGHTSTVRCMCLHNNKVVSGSRDATLRMWDIETGECLHVLMGHIAAVRCVQYDGKRVVSGAYDYMVKIWDPDTETCLHTLQGHTNRVYSLQFDGTHIVSGSLDTSIRVWDVETGQSLHTLIGHQSLTSGMELKDSILVSGNADSTVKVWDIRTGHCLQTLQGPHKHQSAVTCLQFNRRFAVTSSDDGTVKLWSVRTGEFVRDLVRLESGGSGGVVWRLRCSNTKLVCAVGSRNGTEETKLLVLDFDVDDSLPAGDRSKSDSSTPASGSGESSGRRSSVS